MNKNERKHTYIVLYVYICRFTGIISILSYTRENKDNYRFEIADICKAFLKQCTVNMCSPNFQKMYFIIHGEVYIKIEFLNLMSCDFGNI